MCSLDSASTSPGTWRPQQCDHLSWWPGSERRGSGAPGHWTPCGEGACACLPPSSPPSIWPLWPSLPGSPQKSFWPHEPLNSPSSNVLLTSTQNPGHCSQDSVCQDASLVISSHHRIPPTPQVETTFTVRKGKTGSLKEVVCVSDTPYPVPCQQTNTNSFHGQEKGKSQEPLKAWRKHQ